MRRHKKVNNQQEDKTMPITKPRRGLLLQAAATLAACGLGLAAQAATDATPLLRVEPEFPREALMAGADKGHVRARMSIDPSGESRAWRSSKPIPGACSTASS